MKYRIIGKQDKDGLWVYTPQVKRSFWKEWEFFEFYSGSSNEPFYSRSLWAENMIEKHIKENSNPQC